MCKVYGSAVLISDLFGSTLKSALPSKVPCVSDASLYDIKGNILTLDDHPRPQMTAGVKATSTVSLVQLPGANRAVQVFATDYSLGPSLDRIHIAMHRLWLEAHAQRQADSAQMG